MAGSFEDDKAEEAVVLEDTTDLSSGETGEKLFDRILNFRDVGKSINDFLGEKYTPILGSNRVSCD